VAEILSVRQYSKLHASLHVARHERLIGEFYKVKTPLDLRYVLHKAPPQVFRSSVSFSGAWSHFYHSDENTSVRIILDIEIRAFLTANMCTCPIQVAPRLDIASQKSSTIIWFPHTIRQKNTILLLLLLFDSLRAGRSGERIPAGARFSTPVQSGPGARPPSYRVYPRDKAAEA